MKYCYVMKVLYTIRKDNFIKNRKEKPLSKHRARHRSRHAKQLTLISSGKIGSLGDYSFFL